MSATRVQKIKIYIFPILMWHYIFFIEIEVFRPVFIVITALHRYISLISTDMSANNEKKQKNAACNMSTRNYFISDFKYSDSFALSRYN